LCFRLALMHDGAAVGEIVSHGFGLLRRDMFGCLNLWGRADGINF
jgi:hypothetical protein